MPKNANFLGITLMVVSMAGFAAEDAIIKHLLEALPLSQVMILIGLPGTAILAILTLRSGTRFIWADIKHPLILLRTSGDFFGSLFFVVSLALVPLSLLSTIIQINPLLVTLGAAIFLGEKVGVHRWTAIIIGLIGVMIVIRPGGAAFVPAALLTLAGVILMAMRDVVTRRCPKNVPSFVLATLGFATAVPVGMIFALNGDPWVWPTPFQGTLFIGGAFIGAIAFLCIVQAMRVGEVSAVTPFRYSRLIFGTILGLTFFGESLDSVTLLGGAIIVLAGLYALWRERLRGQNNTDQVSANN